MFWPGNPVKAEAVDIYIYHEWYNLTGAPPSASWLFSMKTIASIRALTQNIFDRRDIQSTIDQTKRIMKHPSAVPGNDSAIFLDTRIELQQERCRAVYFDFQARRAIVYGSTLGERGVRRCPIHEVSGKLSVLWSSLADVMNVDGDTDGVVVYNVDAKLVRLHSLHTSSSFELTCSTVAC